MGQRRSSSNASHGEIRHKTPHANPYREAELRIQQSLESRSPELDLSGLQLRTLPARFAELTYLVAISLTGNSLTELPECLTTFGNLQSLSLKRNELSWLPAWLGELKTLRRLTVQENNLTELPESIGNLTELQSLCLKRNSVTELPASIGRLYNLVTLDARYNQLLQLPVQTGELANLQQLFLRDNRLTSLPDSIGRLSQLRQLSVVHNDLRSLPKSLSELANLNELLLHENPALGLCAEVLGPTWTDIARRGLFPKRPSQILEYYFRLRDTAGTRPLLEAKVVLVGRGGVGKTSLSKRLLGEPFDRSEDATHGIRIREWSTDLAPNETVQLHLWDFGGQEIMHSTHQFFLSERSLYLVVVNGRQGGEDAEVEYWLKYIESFGGESPVIVVLNKIRSQPFGLNETRLLREHRLSDGSPRIKAFVRTDCAQDPKGFGLQDLQLSILSEIDQFPDLRAAFPANWFAIKDRLSAMPQHYITFERYREVCSELGEPDTRSQEMLAGFLNDLGVALNYRNDPRLSDKHVLNPYWVTSGVYAVITSNQLVEQNGELQLDDLPRLLDSARSDLDQAGLKPEDYPREMHSFLVGLMRRCELCLAFPDDDGRFLVPGLLSKNEPDLEGEFDSDNCLEFQFRYQLLPEGVLPQFIVKTHSLSDGLPRWRNGVVLQFEHCRALVRADLTRGRVEISICGPVAARRRLLAVIRHDFDQIHKKFRKLEPAERVPLPGHRPKSVKYRELLIREQKGKEFIEVEIGGDIVAFRVKDLLDGVDLDERRRGVTTVNENVADTLTDIRGVLLFISYSHKDERIVEDLKTRLKILSQAGSISDAWYDRRIAPGQDWNDEIVRNLDNADIILLVWSDDFLASNYCYELEMRRALERVSSGNAVIVPIFVRDGHCLSILKSPEGFQPFRDLPPLSRLQGVPRDARPMMQWGDYDSFWRAVSDGIESVARDLRPSGAKKEFARLSGLKGPANESK